MKLMYSIQERDAFSVIGQETVLTGSQNRNVLIAKQFWQTFNAMIKKSFLQQSGNWIKYAFMERRNGKLYYYCAIPQKTTVPEGFIPKEIQPHQYLVAEHVGPMEDIYRTYREIYQEVLPQTHYAPVQREFLHFEKYDSRFHWNGAKSVIEIWIPVL